MGWYKEVLDSCPVSARRIVFGPRRRPPTCPDPLRPQARTSLENAGAWIEDDPNHIVPHFGDWIVETIRKSSEIQAQSRGTRSLVTERWTIQKFLQHSPSEFANLLSTFTQVADHYFGQRSLPVGATLMLSSPRPPSPNTAEELHFDGQIRRVGGAKGCLKVFVAAHEINVENGPLSFLDAQKSKRISQNYRYKKSRSKKRVTDAEAEHVLGAPLESTASKWIAPKGGLLWLDTDRCLHFGSRRVEKPRYLIQFEFTRPEGLDAILDRRRIRQDRSAIDRIPT
jgi:hypothetical protein